MGRSKLRIHPSNLKTSPDGANGVLVEADGPALVEQTVANTWEKAVLARPIRRVAPEDNVLMGATAICRYMHITAIATLDRWVTGYGFPAVKTPGGIWLSSTTAIDEWIWLASSLEAEKRLDARARKVARNAANIDTTKVPYTSNNVERAQRAGKPVEDVYRASAMRRLTNPWMRDKDYSK